MDGKRENASKLAKTIRFNARLRLKHAILRMLKRNLENVFRIYLLDALFVEFEADWWTVQKAFVWISTEKNGPLAVGVSEAKRANR